MKQITVWNGHTQLMLAFSDISRMRVLLFSERLVCTIDHDWLAHYNFSNNWTYSLLFSCAYLKCDKECSSRVFKWVHIPLILYQYISYIVPIFLFPKFLYSYISEARSCLTPYDYDLLLHLSHNNLRFYTADVICSYVKLTQNEVYLNLSYGT